MHTAPTPQRVAEQGERRMWDHVDSFVRRNALPLFRENYARFNNEIGQDCIDRKYVFFDLYDNKHDDLKDLAYITQKEYFGAYAAELDDDNKSIFSGRLAYAMTEKTKEIFEIAEYLRGAK